MSIDLEGLIGSLNVQRAAVDGAIGTYFFSLWYWLGDMQGEAQRVTVYLSLAIIIGRGVLLLLDLRERFRRPSKESICEHLKDHVPKP